MRAEISKQKIYGVFLFILAVRPGELCALGWEDIDLKNGTMMIRRNLAKDRFTVPKTQAGTNRVIHLIKPAIDALRSQMTLTRLSKEHIIDVHLREYGRTEKQKCTFVFQPEVSARVKIMVTILPLTQ